MKLERRPPPTRERRQMQMTGLVPSDGEGPLFERSCRSNDRVTEIANGRSWPAVRVHTNHRKAAVENSNVTSVKRSSNWCYRPGPVSPTSCANGGCLDRTGRSCALLQRDLKILASNLDALSTR
ncbi:hypothetical protein OKW42_007190 [Paraburkholderia sp. WC7.3d]